MPEKVLIISSQLLQSCHCRHAHTISPKLHISDSRILVETINVTYILINNYKLAEKDTEHCNVQPPNTDSLACQYKATRYLHLQLFT